MIHKIITHNGIFHADDVMSVALLHECISSEIPIERKRNISFDGFTNPNVWLVDVGGQYDALFNNFDHHQDSTLPAACMIVLLELRNKDIISEDMKDELFGNIHSISHIDCNGPLNMEGFQFNTLIKSFNTLDNGWDLALSVCRAYIQSCKSTVAKIAESRDIWDSGEKISLYIRSCQAFPIHWKRYEEQPFLVYPHDGKYNLISSNSDHFPLMSTGRESFMHANRFLAVFDNKEDAIICAQRSTYNAIG